MPRTLSGEIDISFLKKLPFWNQQFGTGEDSLQVEFHANLNSLVNTFETQVNIICYAKHHACHRVPTDKHAMNI